MNSHPSRPSRFPVLACLLLVTCLALGAASTWPAWARNRAALALNRALAPDSDQIAGAVAILTSQESTAADVSFYHRDAGHRYLAAGNRPAAGRAFAAADWDAGDFAAMAEHSFQSDPARAIDWLALATTAGPGERQFTLRLGEACRNDWSQDDACRWFLDQNGGNHFLNPDFAAGLGGWTEIGAPADYATVPCPENSSASCAAIVVNAVQANPPAGLSQCFQVEPGATYRFSAWLKVTTTPDGLWRPLYFQGTIDEQPRGNWAGDEPGATEWRFLERTFVAPAFDDGQACFSPIRLLSAGQAWFHDSELIELPVGSSD